MTEDPIEPLAGKSVLVTGGAGFIGSHLAATLSKACEVTVLDDLSTGDPSNVPDDVDFVQGDVRDLVDLEDAMRGVDVVFHEASLVSVDASVRSPVESHTRTGSGTVKVLDAARREDARAVVASSAAIYGHPDRLPIHESDRKTPTSPYGIDKLAADHYTRTFAELYDLPTVALRYFNVYGPGQADSEYAGVVAAFIERARRGAPLVVHGDGEQTRDFVHVDDIVRANLLAASTDATGRAYNVGTGTGVSVREVAETVSDHVDGDVEITHGDPREGDIKHSRAEIGRARSDLGYEPTISFADGIGSMLDRTAPAN